MQELVPNTVFFHELEKESTDIRQLFDVLISKHNFSAAQVIDLCLEFQNSNNSNLNRNKQLEIVEKLFEYATEYVQYDESYKDTLVLKIAEHYDKIGTLALYITTACSVIESLKVIYGLDLSSILPIMGNISNHVGNADGSFYQWSTVYMGLSAVRSIDIQLTTQTSEWLAAHETIKVLLEIGKAFWDILIILLPYIVLTLATLYQIDAETFQILPGSFGVADTFDIPAGLISIVGLAKIFEMQRFHRPYVKATHNVQALSNELPIIKNTVDLAVKASRFEWLLFPTASILTKNLIGYSLREKKPVKKLGTAFNHLVQKTRKVFTPDSAKET